MSESIISNTWLYTAMCDLASSFQGLIVFSSTTNEWSASHKSDISWHLTLKWHAFSAKGWKDSMVCIYTPCTAIVIDTIKSLRKGQWLIRPSGCRWRGNASLCSFVDKLGTKAKAWGKPIIWYNAVMTFLTSLASLWLVSRLSVRCRYLLCMFCRTKRWTICLFTIWRF